MHFFPFFFLSSFTKHSLTCSCFCLVLFMKVVIPLLLFPPLPPPLPERINVGIESSNGVTRLGRREKKGEGKHEALASPCSRSVYSAKGGGRGRRREGYRIGCATEEGGSRGETRFKLFLFFFGGRGSATCVYQKKLCSFSLPFLRVLLLLKHTGIIRSLVVFHIQV